MSATTESLLPPDPVNRGGMNFGYAGWVTERAMKADDPAILAECIARGFIDEKSTMLDATSIARQCERIGSAKCAAMLRGRGWK